MERRSRVHLDHPTIRGRVREPQVRRAHFENQTDLHGHSTPRTSHDPAVIKPMPDPLSAPLANKPLSPDGAQPVADLPVDTTISKRGKETSVLRIRTQPMISGEHGGTTHLPRQTRSGVLRRQMVKSTSKKYRPKKHRSFKPALFTGIATIVLLAGAFGVFVGIKKLHNNSSTAVLSAQTTHQGNQDNGTSGNDMPTEDNPPTDINNYTVSPNMPRFLIIDKLGINARVRRVGPDSDNVIKGPSNIFDVGWYENSSEPGGNGTVLIDGHVSGETKRGVFYGLNTLKKDDKIIIERGDGKRITYTVVSTEQADYDYLNMKKVMTSIVPEKPGLNLMSATGRFNVRTNQYEKRVIIYATQD